MTIEMAWQFSLQFSNTKFYKNQLHYYEVVANEKTQKEYNLMALFRNENAPEIIYLYDQIYQQQPL